MVNIADMKHAFIAIIHLLFFQQIGNSQTFWIPKKSLYDFLYKSPETFPHLHFNNEEIFVPTSKKNNKRIIGSIAKNKNGLFIIVFGTGQVYKATAITEKEMAITRMDSTIFWGNNFSSHDFSYNDTLFSFGGYGFWNLNGQLRYFQEGGEWQIFKLNDEHVLNSGFCQLDSKNGKLYYIQLPFNAEAEEKEVKIFSVFQLDLKTKKNKFLGEINLPFNIESAKWNFYSPSLNGIILYSDNGFWYLLQLNQNKVFKLKQKSKIDWINNSAKISRDLMFEVNDSLYMYTNTEDLIRSIDISMNDFEIQRFSIYKAPRNSKYDIIYVFSGISILLFFLTLYLFKKRVKNYKTEENHTAEIENSLETVDFTELEKLIIDNILTKSKSNATMKVEDLNKILGLGKKTLAIQKKTRSEILNRINHKYKNLYFQETDLIESIRSNHDKRFYNYLINSKNIEIFERGNKKSLRQSDS